MQENYVCDLTHKLFINQGNFSVFVIERPHRGRGNPGYQLLSRLLCRDFIPPRNDNNPLKLQHF